MRSDSSGRWIVAAALMAAGFGLPQVATATAPSQTADAKSSQGPKGDQMTVYTCPMHPEVTSDKPGKCPKCGMKLVPKAGATPPPDKK